MERTTRETLLRIYQETETIAVVGASTTEGKPGHDIPLYLQSQGFRIIPVNPRGGRILGEPSFASLRDVDVPVDVVDVFRPPEEAETIARDAIAIGAYGHERYLESSRTTFSRFARHTFSGVGGRMSSQIAAKLPSSCGIRAGRAMNHQCRCSEPSPHRQT